MQWITWVALLIALLTIALRRFGLAPRRHQLLDIPDEWHGNEDLSCPDCTGKVSPMRTPEGWRMVCGMCGVTMSADEYRLQVGNND